MQPVLDRNCVSCHNGKNAEPDFRKDQMVTYKRGILTKINKQYDQSYLNLHPYVYRQGPESDIYVLKPAEFHASNSELIRILQAGHHGVEVPEEDMRTLYAWIDLNAPYYGAFTQIDLKPQSPKGQVERRMELAEKYSGVQAVSYTHLIYNCLLCDICHFYLSLYYHSIFFQYGRKRYKAYRLFSTR